MVPPPNTHVSAVTALLEKFGRILLYETGDAIAKLYSTV